MELPHDKKTRIVIVGAGFGGTYAYRHLHRLLHGQKDVTLTMINRENYFLFTPLLHEVATGGMSGENVIQPIREVLGCCVDDLICSEVRGISFESRTVHTRERDVPYDYAIIALGSETNFYNVPGAEKHSFQLKSISDALALKNHFIDMFERASQTDDEAERQKLLTFVVVGGGATGVELACEMSDFFYGSLCRYYPLEKCRDRVRIILVNQGAELIQQFPEKLRRRAYGKLTEKKVDVCLSTAVKKVERERVLLSDGRSIGSATSIWVAGIHPTAVSVDRKECQDASCRFVVNEALQSVVDPAVFAIGDIATFGPGKQPLPQLAQVATKEAAVAAQNIVRAMRGKPLSAFTYKSSGSLISFGEWDAGASIGGVTLYGPVAWLLWRTVYLFKLHGLQKKIQVVIDWTFDLFKQRDISRLE